MNDPANRKGRSVRRRWPTIAIAIVTVLIGASAIAVYFLANKPSARVTELYTYQFAASAERFAFLHVEGDERADLVVYNPQENRLVIYRPRWATIWSLSANAAKSGDFFVSLWRPINPDQFRSGEQAPMKLLRCGIGKCEAVFDFPGSIGSPIDLGNGETLFISAKPQIAQHGWPPGSPEFVGYRIFDFYFRSREGRFGRITEWKAFFSSASLGEDRILFNFTPMPGSPTPQPPNHPRTSEIWAAKVTKDGIPHLAFDGEGPFIEHGQNLDTKPSISPDASKTAFLSSSGYTPNNQWRYDIAVVDNASKNELFTAVAEDGTRLSLPVFVDNDHVRFMSFDGARYSFREISVSAKQEKVLGQVTPEELSHAEVVYLDNAPADGR